MLLALDNLTKRYGQALALEGITMEVGEGSIGLLGPNGAGKSTLIKTLLGLLNFQEGQGRVLGLDIRKESKKIREIVGYMPERDAYFPDMSGLDYVTYSARLSGLAWQDSIGRSHEVLDYLGFGEERYRLVDTYSTGMRQKVKLAQALVHDPKLVFLDEPTNGLDPEGREEMLELVRSLWEKAEINVILSSHVLPDVEKVCDQVIILVDGRVQAVDSMENLKNYQDNTYLVQAKGNLARFQKALKKKGFQIREKFPGEWEVSRKKWKSTLEFFEVACREKIEIRKFQKKKRTLEDIFLEAVEVEKEE